MSNDMLAGLVTGFSLSIFSAVVIWMTWAIRKVGKDRMERRFTRLEEQIKESEDKISSLREEVQKLRLQRIDQRVS